MPRQGWADAVEQAFLKRQLPQYEVCKANQNYTEFWSSTVRAFVEETKTIGKWFPGKTDKSELSASELKEYNAQYEKLKKVSAHI